MSGQIIVLSDDISNLGDNTSGLKKDENFLVDRPQGPQQHSSEMVNENENVRVPLIRGRKIATITANAKPAVRKLLTMSIKMVLVEDRQDMSVSKI